MAIVFESIFELQSVHNLINQIDYACAKLYCDPLNNRYLQTKGLTQAIREREGKKPV